MINITDTEQAVMRILWTKKTATSREIIDEAQASHQWSVSTIKTLLRRLTEKGAITVDKTNKIFIYQPAIAERETATDQAHHLFATICDAQKGSLLTDLIKDQPLSQADIATLQGILQERLHSAPTSVGCHCLHQDIGQACAEHSGPGR